MNKAEDQKRMMMVTTSILKLHMHVHLCADATAQVCPYTHKIRIYIYETHTHTIEIVEQRLDSELRLPTDTEVKEANLSPTTSPATTLTGKAYKVGHDGLWSSLMHAGSLSHTATVRRRL